MFKDTIQLDCFFPLLLPCLRHRWQSVTNWSDAALAIVAIVIGAGLFKFSVALGDGAVRANQVVVEVLLGRRAMPEPGLTG